MDFTMLRQISRYGHVSAMLHDIKETNDLASILEPEHLHKSYIPSILTNAEQASILKQSVSLTNGRYQFLLHYLQATGCMCRDVNDLPHPSGSLVLPPLVQEPLQITCNDHVFSCYKSHQGNSYIRFYNPLTQEYGTGSINTIWMLPLENKLRKFLIVHPHILLPIEEECKAPFLN